MSFLKAEWRKLAIANYEVPEEILAPFVPYGTELDIWEDKCYVSLVGFMFVNTKLLGVKVPFHINFEEVNLRFYVKRQENGKWKRGVVFVKEIVPKPALTFVANTVYNEHYETMKMRHLWKPTSDNLLVKYEWKKSGSWNFFEVNAMPNSAEIIEGSKTEFITEHYWGYAKVNERKSNEYEVTHPKWEHYPLKDYTINVDFGAVYGQQFQFLNNSTPESVMLAEGSEITVENKRILK